MSCTSRAGHWVAQKTCQKTNQIIIFTQQDASDLAGDRVVCSMPTTENQVQSSHVSLDLEFQLFSGTMPKELKGNCESEHLPYPETRAEPSEPREVSGLQRQSHWCENHKGMKTHNLREVWQEVSRP